MTWRIRIVGLLQLLILVASMWDGLRNVIVPDGTTGAELVILLVLLIIWEELLRIRRHFKIDV